jgi:hypothetical protein
VHSQHADEVLRFLLCAGEELANSLDYETTLQSVARQAVPVLADLCVVDLIGSDGRLRPVAAAHLDANVEPWLRELTFGEESPATVLRAFRTRQPLIVPDLYDDALITDIAREGLRGNARWVCCHWCGVKRRRPSFQRTWL